MGFLERLPEKLGSSPGSLVSDYRDCIVRPWLGLLVSGDAGDTEWMFTQQVDGNLHDWRLGTRVSLRGPEPCSSLEVQGRSRARLGLGCLGQF